MTGPWAARANTVIQCLTVLAAMAAASPAHAQDIVGVRTDRTVYWNRNTAQVTVTLSAAAPRGGYSVALEAWFTNTPSEVLYLGDSYYTTIPMGARTITIPGRLWYNGDDSYTGDRMVIRAKSARTRTFPTCSITVCPVPSVKAVTFSPKTVRSGALASGTVTLYSPASVPGTSVMVGCGTQVVTVAIPQGRTGASFTLRAPSVGKSTLLYALTRGEVAPGVWAGWLNYWANVLTVTP